MRMRKKKNLIPRMEACAGLWIKDPAERRGNWRALMPQTDRLRLELGCGKGRFTAQTAAAHPQDLYVAVERVPDAMVIAMERCRELGLTNVFFIDGDAAALGDCFAPDEVDLIYINFCDPWPSLKHARRRLTHQNFLRGYREILKEEGEIHFKTDNRDLFEWSLFQFPKAGFALSEITRDLHAEGVRGIMTDYEDKFHSLGVPINRCVATKGKLPNIPIVDGLAALLPQWEVRPVDEENFQAVLAMLIECAGDCILEGDQPSARMLREGMTNLPPRCTMEQKHYLALWRDGAPQVLLDLVEGYPRPYTLFLGLLHIHPASRRQGVGRVVTGALLRAAGQAGHDRVRLACLQNNREGLAFWQAMDFQIIREDKLLGERSSPVWIMERLTEGSWK